MAYASDKKPKITIMGEEVPWEELPGDGIVDLMDYFKPMTIAPRALDQASRIVPTEFWKGTGIHSWLLRRADHLYRQLPVDKTEGRLGIMKYVFENTPDGPILLSVSL